MASGNVRRLVANDFAEDDRSADGRSRTSVAKSSAASAPGTSVHRNTR